MPQPSEALHEAPNDHLEALEIDRMHLVNAAQTLLSSGRVTRQEEQVLRSVIETFTWVAPSVSSLPF